MQLDLELTCIDRFLMWKQMKIVCFVFDISEVPDFDCLIHRCCSKHPLTSGVKLYMSHFLLVQFQLPDLQQTENHVGKKKYLE